MTKIEVRLNPDVPPSGSDLAIVNAARRSFGTRSDWEYTCECGVKKVPEVEYNKWVGCSADQRECHNRRRLRTLKDKDRRLIEFLARGMTTQDFDGFLHNTAQQGHNTIAGDDYDYYGENLKDLLWQWRNTPTHSSPFGHCFLSFELKIPIFLARQLVKHKFLRWSEFSRRYITDEVEFYEHEYRNKAKDAKQGSVGVHENTGEWVSKVSEHNLGQLTLYNNMLEDGVAPEQARGVLPADMMTSLTWSGSLDAFTDMCVLRLGDDSQKEAQYVAEEIYQHLEKFFPVSAKSLVYGC